MNVDKKESNQTYMILSIDNHKEKLDWYLGHTKGEVFSKKSSNHNSGILFGRWRHQSLISLQKCNYEKLISS